MITVIGNLKGGTGKSTLTFNLAVWLRSAQIETTVIDLDPQKTLADVAALRLEEGIEPPIHVHTGPLPDVSQLRFTDETLIDVGTADLESFKHALTIADRVLIPVTPSQADIWSTQRFVRFLHSTTHGQPPESLTILNRADTSRTVPNSDEAAAALTSLPGVRLIPQRLSDRTTFRDSFSEGLAVFELEPRSKAASELRALAAILFSKKRRFVEDRPASRSAPDASHSVNRNEIGAPPTAQTFATTTKPGESKTQTVDREPQLAERNLEESSKKHGTAETKKAGKGKKHKGHKKGKKDKQGKKNRKSGKSKKAKKGKKGKKGS